MARGNKRYLNVFHNQGTVKNSCNVLIVLCGERTGSKQKQNALGENQTYPISSGRLEVQTLKNPTKDEFCEVLDSLKPNLVYIQGQLLRNDKIGSLVWQGSELPSRGDVSELFSSTRPATVYLELANGERLAESLHFKGIPYVIYWKSSFSCHGASHFRYALFSALQSSPSHTWDAFRLAHASYRLHCLRDDVDQVIAYAFTPNILGKAPKINVDIPEIKPGDDNDEESSSGSVPTLKIYDDHISMKLLVCGMTDSLDASLLGSLEDGLNALLSIEMRESKLHNRASALPPPLQAGTFSRDVVTMRCGISTSSSAHISLLVSGSAQTCFDDQLLENHIKNEIIEHSHLVHAPPNSDDNKPSISEPRRSLAVACGAPVFEVCLKVPSWAAQVLRQLAHDISYRTLAALGIASIQGLPVSSFEKEDADRLLFFCKKRETTNDLNDRIINGTPTWLTPPPPCRKRQSISQETSFLSSNDQEHENVGPIVSNGINANGRKNIKVAALRPIPHIHRHKMLPFSRISSEASAHNGNHVKANLPITPPTKHSGVDSAPITHSRKSASGSKQAKQTVSLNPLPVKKHNCRRSPLPVCTEEEFLKDVMQFLILQGHTRLIPQGGMAEFPDVVLNTKRLDLFNLYREVVTRGGFHVGNGINWKGQVFSKMRNHTVTNRMTGVGNALKRHYQTYLLEYELAHDDVDGECCLMCLSGAPGDWVNCGMCGEWAHFGCDRRPGLGTFKDYAKTGGLDYVCPQCSSSASNRKKKKRLQKPSNGYP